MKCIIGKKIEMTRVFDDNGNATPVTVIAAGKQTVTQVRATQNGTSSIQVGTNAGSKNVNKPQKGHLKGFQDITLMRDFRLNNSETFDRGDTWGPGVFEKGEKVTVTGTAKGRGFQGVVKRHGFHGSPASHGHKDQLRMPGSIASRTQGPVAKGKKMGGRMGGNRVSVHNIVVVDVLEEEGLLYLKGAIPGARGSLVLIKGEGEMEVQKFEKEDVSDSVEKEQASSEEIVTQEETKTEQKSSGIIEEKVVAELVAPEEKTENTDLAQEKSSADDTPDTENKEVKS